MKLENELDVIRARWGPWTAHNIQLDDNVFTISKNAGNRVSHRADLYLELIKIFAHKNFSELKVLDLGCLEGGISIKLAQAGMTVVGTDVREGHIRKCEYVSNKLNLNDQLTWLIGDVTDDSFWNSLGLFDVIICSGLLYHIADKDIYKFVKCMRAHNASPSGLTIIDTNITSSSKHTYQVSPELSIHGRQWIEHKKGKSIRDRIKDSWSSLNNDHAFWMTERSLVNIFVASNYSSFHKPLYPFHEWGHKNRDVWVALAGDYATNYTLRSEPDNRPVEHPGLN